MRNDGFVLRSNEQPNSNPPPKPDGLLGESQSRMSAVPRLRVTEIFHSLQGQGLTTGERTAFVRLSGCPLRCTYCDTAYAFTGGESMTI